MPSRFFWTAALLASCLWGCEQAQPVAAVPPVAVNNAALIPLEIQLNWFPEAEHGGYYAALVHGYYAEEGFDVTLKPGGPGAPLLQNVALGRAPFGVDNADKLLVARAQEANLVAVFAPIQDSPRCILVHQESGVTKLDDLKTADGLTLAWNPAQPFAQFLSQKFDLSRITVVKYSGSISPFLQDQKYAQQAYNISEPFLATKQGASPIALMLSDAGFNTYTSLLLTNAKYAQEQAETVRKVVRASQRGWRKYLTDADETNRKIAELNLEMPVDVLAYGVAELRKLCQPDELPEAEIGRMEAQRWETLNRQLEEIEVVKPGAANVRNAYTTEFLPSEK